MIGWHHQLNGHEFEQTPEVREGQGSLVCCNNAVTEQQQQQNSLAHFATRGLIEKSATREADSPGSLISGFQPQEL